MLKRAVSAGLSQSITVKKLALLQRVLAGLATSIEDADVPLIVREAESLGLADVPTVRYLNEHVHKLTSTPNAAEELQQFDFAPTGDCYFSVVGESHYQAELRHISRSGRTFTAVVMAEPTNAFDPNAIRVCSERGRTIAYFSRDQALDYRDAFTLLHQSGHVGRCRAKLIGGSGDKKSFGVMLDIKDPESLCIDVRNALAQGTAAPTSVQPF